MVGITIHASTEATSASGTPSSILQGYFLPKPLFQGQSQTIEWGGVSTSKVDYERKLARYQALVESKINAYKDIPYGELPQPIPKILGHFLTEEILKTGKGIPPGLKFHEMYFFDDSFEFDESKIGIPRSTAGPLVILAIKMMEEIAANPSTKPQSLVEAKALVDAAIKGIGTIAKGKGKKLMDGHRAALKKAEELGQLEEYHPPIVDPEFIYESPGVGGDGLPLNLQHEYEGRVFGAMYNSTFLFIGPNGSIQIRRFPSNKQFLDIMRRDPETMKLIKAQEPLRPPIRELRDLDDVETIFDQGLADELAQITRNGFRDLHTVLDTVKEIDVARLMRDGFFPETINMNILGTDDKDVWHSVL